MELETKLLQRTCLEKARHVQKVLEYLPEKEVAQVCVCVVMSCGASHDSTHMLQTGLCGKASIFGSFGQSE